MTVFGSVIGVVGLGSTGAHVVRQLRDAKDIGVLAFDIDIERQKELVETVGANVSAGTALMGGSDVVVLASPAGGHGEGARALLERGISVVSLSDSPEDIEALLSLDQAAKDNESTLIVGAGFAPGLSCLLARFAGDTLDVVEEIAVAKAGTAGPACARQHHLALKSDGRDWIDQQWITRRGGSGRDLAWFPGSIGARDCYRGALPSPTLLQKHYPEAQRISARMSATRRDRFTSRLPMLRRPHRDGGPGAIRVEVRGRVGGSYETRIYGVLDHPSVAAGTVAAVVAKAVLDGRFSHGASGLAQFAAPGDLLAELHRRGVKAARFGGTQSR